MKRSARCFLLLSVSLIMPRIVSAQSQWSWPDIKFLNPLDSVKLRHNIDSLRLQNYRSKMPVRDFKYFDSKMPIAVMKDFKSRMPVLSFKDEKPAFQKTEPK